MAEEKTYVFGDGNNGYNNGWGGVPFSIPVTGFGYGNGYGYGGGLLGGGFGAGILGGILGGLIPGFFGGWGNGFGLGNNGNGGAAAASLGAQATANANSEMILNAINGTDADVRLLATTLNSDVDSIRLAINTVQGAIQTVGSQLGLTGQQVINALQMGDANISRQICECCCQSQLRTVEQTNALNSAILTSGQRTVDAIADLKATTIEQFCALERRDMQNELNTKNEIITQLRNEADNARQTAQFGAMLAPIAKEVNDIQCKLPATTPVIYPQISAVNTTPNIGGFYGFGNGFGGNIVF